MHSRKILKIFYEITLSCAQSENLIKLKLNLKYKREITESHQAEISFKHEIFFSTSLIFAGRDTKALVQEYQQRIPLQITSS